MRKMFKSKAFVYFPNAVFTSSAYGDK